MYITIQKLWKLINHIFFTIQKLLELFMFRFLEFYKTFALAAKPNYFSIIQPFMLMMAFQLHCVHTVKPLSGHSKIDNTKVLMTNGSLMKVKSIVECSKGCILQYF